jgi:hypothetical protein
MPRLINIELISNPMNWLIIILMLFFGSVILHIVMGDQPLFHKTL